MKKKFKKAFSLIELSIVIVIVSILITGALSMSVSSINTAKVKVTNDRIREIYKALGAYLLVNKKLPCPAALNAIKSSAGSSYGVSIGSDGTCSGAAGEVYASGNLVYGAVPIRALGLANDMGEDGFEDKIAYVVDKGFTSSSSFGSTPSTVVMTIKERSNNADQVVTSDAILVLVSHGMNKSGAFPANASVQNTASSDAQEADNHLDAGGTFNNTFYASSSNSDVFDDIVFFKTRNSLLTENNALSVVGCTGASSNSPQISYGSPTPTNIVWPDAAYDEISVASTACPTGYTAGPKYPTRKCGAFGSWGSVVNPCVQNPPS